jgi:hypothetical protein
LQAEGFTENDVIIGIAVLSAELRHFVRSFTLIRHQNSWRKYCRVEAIPLSDPGEGLTTGRASQLAAAAALSQDSNAFDVSTDSEYHEIRYQRLRRRNVLY